MSGETSRALFARAQKRIPGGVNSPARAFARVGGEPFFVARGDGARIFDADGRALVDFVNSWGAAIVGHARAEVLRAVEAALAGGLGFGCPTAIEVEFRRNNRRLAAGNRNVARRDFRHRSDNVGDPRRARIHRPRFAD